MGSQSFKLDVTIEVPAPGETEQALEIKLGDPLQLVPSAEGLACLTADGQRVAAVPADAAARLRGGDVAGSVRSVKRQHPGGAVSQVLARFVPREREAQPQPEPAPRAAHSADEPDVDALPRERLEALARDEEVRWLLRDERLQKVVASIDGAPDRDRALQRALENPNFKDFADKVLDVVSPQPPE